MAEYLIQGETLTNLGDKIRVLSGSEETMTPNTMTTKVGEANDEVNTQEELINQIASVLEGKASGSGGGENAVKTCTIKFVNEIASSGQYVAEYGYTSYENGEISVVHANMLQDRSSELTFNNVVCGSFFYLFSGGYSFAGIDVSSNMKNLLGCLTCFSAPLESGSIGVITAFDDN